MKSFTLIVFSLVAFVAVQDINAALMGGWNDGSVDDARVLSGLKSVLQQTNQSGSIKILEVKQQVVAGMNYQVKFELTNPQTHSRICTTTFYVNLQNKVTIKDFNCN